MIQEANAKSTKFSKKCPNCDNIILFTTKYALNYSISKNVLCNNCKKEIKTQKSKRNCPSCQKVLIYSDHKTCSTANRKNTLCKSCGIKKTCSSQERRKEMSERVRGERNPMHGKTGNLNPFYGKKHSKEFCKKLSEERSGVPISEDHKQKIKNYAATHNNPMKGRSVYSVWLKKYGKDIADQKMNDFKRKQSIINTGKNNSMYGKPSPQGSGNGWKGWYKNIFFRSLRELSYLIYLIENGVNWASAETSKYSIEYLDLLGNEKTYRPDFIIDNNIIIEIKPKRLHDSPLNKLKQQAALNFCKQNNLEYRIIDIEINSNKILEKFNNNEIEFINDYKERFLKYMKLI